MNTMKKPIALCIIMLSVMSLTAQTTVTYTAHFDSDESQLNRNGISLFNQFISGLPLGRVASIDLSGHTDSIGSENYNDDLSQKRVNYIRGLFDTMNIQHAGTQTTWSGELNPVDGKDNLADNRRVEIHVVLNDAKLPDGFRPNALTYDIDPQRDTILSIGTCGSQLRIPSKSFVGTDGKIVRSRVRLTYTEYNNSADMAFSGIKMTYQKDNNPYRFNSSGMFDLRGERVNGDELRIVENSNVSLSYCLAKQNENIDFYLYRHFSIMSIICGTAA